jgi:hypothetical protein
MITTTCWIFWMPVSGELVDGDVPADVGVVAGELVVSDAAAVVEVAAVVDGDVAAVDGADGEPFPELTPLHAATSSPAASARTAQRRRRRTRLRIASHHG